MEDIRSESSETPSSLDSDDSVSSSNHICYGPIHYFRRKGKAPTLLTGRKSKFEELQGEELAERERRREKNRLLSRRLKEKRDNIQNELVEKLNQLENKHSYLLHQVEHLYSRRSDLTNQVEQLREDPLIDLIQHNGRLYFEDFADDDFDTDSMIVTLADE